MFCRGDEFLREFAVADDDDADHAAPFRLRDEFVMLPWRVWPSTRIQLCGVSLSQAPLPESPSTSSML
jgi:hypothetical protein